MYLFLTDNQKPLKGSKGIVALFLWIHKLKFACLCTGNTDKCFKLNADLQYLKILSNNFPIPVVI